MSLVLLCGLLAAAAGLTNWWAIIVGRKPVERAAKPLTMVALGALALSLGAGDTSTGRWLLLALVLCLIGDVALLGESTGHFLAGLTAFLLGHLAYVACFVALGLRGGWPWALIGLGVVAISLAFGRRILPTVARTEGATLAAAVAAYMLVIAAMAATGWATGRALIGLGVSSFVVSDTVLAINKFVAPLRRGQLLVMVTYHLAQVLIVLGVLLH
jgi:uncharacterized membrane protein YhhN